MIFYIKILILQKIKNKIKKIEFNKLYINKIKNHQYANQI